MSAEDGRSRPSRRLSGSQQRRLLGGAAALVVVIVLVVLLTSGGDDEASGGQEAIDLPQVGLALRAPSDWSRDISEDSVELRSADQTVVLSVSSPVEGREPAAVKRALQNQLREQLAPAEITEEGPGRLGEREVVSFELSGEIGGRPVTAVALVEDTPFRTYAVTLFTGNTVDSPEALQEAREILRSVELTEPEGANGDGGSDGAEADR